MFYNWEDGMLLNIEEYKFWMLKTDHLDQLNLQWNLSMPDFPPSVGGKGSMGGRTAAKLI